MMKRGIFEETKNIEDKSEEQLKIIWNNICTRSQIDLFDKDLSPETVEIKGIENNFDYSKLSFTVGNKKPHSFKKARTLKMLRPF